MAHESAPELQAVEKYGGKRSSLVQILHETQREYRYLPERALRNIAARMDIPLTDIYGVVTFFKAFSLQPKGRHTVTLCMGTACHVRNAEAILGEAKRTLGIAAGETTEDMLFSLETVNCLGACAIGPILVVDGAYHGQMTAVKTKSLLKKLAGEGGCGR